LQPTDSIETWENDFLTADPNRYHQFKNKTAEKKISMARAARKDAIEKL
jgi:hypothetical protein